MFMRAHAGKKVRIMLSENIAKRSLQANSFYWACVVPAVREFRMDNGDTVSNEQVHEDLIAEFAPQIECRALDPKAGKAIGRRYKRTSEMDKKEMADYIDAIRTRLAAFVFHIPVEGE